MTIDGQSSSHQYPEAARDEVTEILGGCQVPDPYRWLECADTKETQAWLTSQSGLLHQQRKKWALQARFDGSLRRLTAFELLSAPVWCGRRAFLTRRPVGAQHTVLAVEESGSLRDLVDPYVVHPSADATLGRWAPSPDGRLVAYELAADGREEFSLHVIDVDSGKNVDGPIDGCRYVSIAWLPGQDAFYYVRRTRTGDRQGVFLHRVGQPGPEVEVFGAGFGETAQFEICLGPDGRRLVVMASTGLSSCNELWWAHLGRTSADKPRLRPVNALRGGWNTVWPARDGACYVLTEDAAPHGRLVVIRASDDETRPEVATVIPEDADVVLESVAVLDGAQLRQPLLLSLTVRDGRSAVNRHDLRTGQLLGQVELPGPGIVSELSFRQDGGHEAWFTYSDRATPETVYQYDARTDRCAPWRPAPSIGVPPIVVTEESYRSTDGAEVRLLLTRPADAPAGPLPTILQGYGAFGDVQVADYYAAALAWAECGGLFAVACVRGGGESGETWHAAGSRGNKQQGIDDFAAAAEYLTAAGHAAPGRLGAFGQSAGGLLAAAVMTQHPGLFTAVACTSAPLDMARYELTGLGSYWIEEFGTRTKPDELAWLLGYSPYHRVQPGTSYPAVLLTALGEDTRVDPLHSRKMCAALQHATSAALEDRPVLLRYETGAGHGERSRDGRLAYFADVLAFFDHSLNRKPLSNERGLAAGEAS